MTLSLFVFDGWAKSIDNIEDKRHKNLLPITYYFFLVTGN
ncbi:hypothetical protein STA3757_19950 [Stanieria sp. NIES-3757]|nr:hypothetical protein STA3757_19950 [Stanieria sp. NIES-3757]